ncbi:MAG: hypothetical protein P1V97_24220 [Planctomycetota bacterium]|nr:hypothetical protein [Planctomycetota bacterium]
MSALEVNLKGGRISDLINWPNHVFGHEDANPNDDELTEEQLVGYALLLSRREVLGTRENNMK